MKILLINPPIPDINSNRDGYIPSGLLYIASALKKENIEINFIDFNIFDYSNYENILKNNILKNNPSFIGIGSLFSGQFVFVNEMAKKIKRYFNIPIIIGGIHPTLHYKQILENCEYIDFIILGEGENSIVSLIKTINEKKYKFKEIDGLAYRRNDKILCNYKKDYIFNLDNINFPFYKLLNLKEYYKDTTNWYNPKNLSINYSIPIITSRGCFMKCNFCANYHAMGEKWRFRSYKNVVDEIEFLYKEYNHKHFSFMDDNFTADKKRVINICNEILKRKLDIQFETPNGIYISTLDKEIIETLAETGLTRLSLPIESGSDYIRNKIMRKNISRKKIFEIINYVKKYSDIIIRTFYIVGMPEETKNTLEDTYRMIQDTNVDLPVISNLMPFYGTEVFEQCLKDKLFIDNVDINNLWLKNSFYLSNKDFFIKPYNLEIEELYRFREKVERLKNKK